MNKNMKPIIGIDWGTSRSYPAVVDQDGICQSLLPSSNHICSGGIPSLFAYNEEDGNILCDDVVSEELEIYEPEQVVSSIKMRLSESFCLDGEVFNGIEIAEYIIETQMRFAMEELEIQDLEADDSKVVVCAPVSFGTAERSLLRKAFENAGYEVIRIIPEPVAAAIYYGKKGTILVLDIGAGTTDVAIVKENLLMTAKTPYPYLYVDSTGIKVAGDMFDERIADYLVKRFIREVDGIDAGLLKDSEGAAYRRMKAAARRAKESLSNKWEVGVVFNGREAGSGRIKLTRQEMNEAIHPLVKEITACVKDLMNRNTNINMNELEIVMTGGSSYIPYIKEMLAQTFPQILSEKIYIKAPEKAIGFGAAIYAADHNQICVKVDFSYGVNTYIDDVEMIQTLIPAGAELPYTVTHNYRTRHENQTKVSFNLYEYRSRDKELPIDNSIQMKVAAAVHEFNQPVAKGTQCTAKMTLTEDGILKLEVISKISSHVGRTTCSVFTDSDSGR